MRSAARKLAARLRRHARRDPLLTDVRRAAGELGVPVWIVGGYVRDAALGRSALDLDLAAGKGAKALAKALERKWHRRLFRFTKRGVTTWRSRVGDRDIDLVDAGTRGIDRDLARRDFTVNAMAFDLSEETVLDPLHGLSDLRRKVLRLPRPNVFREDPLRALRAARFLATLPGFRLDPAVRAAAKRVAPAVARVSVERVFEELDRLLVSADPRRGLRAMEELGLVRSVLPELVPLASCIAGADRPDVWTHTLDALDAAAHPSRLPGGDAVESHDEVRVLRWALLLHDISKPETLAEGADGRPTFHGHEVAGSRRAVALLKRLRAPVELRERVGRAVLFHLRPHHLAEAGAPERGMRRLVREAGDDLPLLVLHAACDARASGSPDARTRWRRLRPILSELVEIHRITRASPVLPLLSGRDVMEVLGIPPGPAVGAAIRELRDLQAEGQVTDRNQAIAYLFAKTTARPPNP